jgi:hypothetical protein
MLQRRWTARGIGTNQIPETPLPSQVATCTSHKEKNIKESVGKK